MNKIMYKSIASGFLIIALMLANGALPVFADDRQPPPPPTHIESITTSTQLTSPKVSGGPSPNGVLPGPGGGSATLSSMLSYYSQGCFLGCTWRIQGGASVSPSGGAAKAWTTINGIGVYESTAGSPCWASSGSSCTSSSSWWTVGRGGYWNDAETVVYWTGGGTSYGSVRASVTF